MREGLQELQDGPSSPSTPSIILSMGGILWTRKKDLMEKDNHGCHKMLMILLPCLAQCLSMGEATLHFITSIEKDGNSSSTLFF